MKLLNQRVCKTLSCRLFQLRDLASPARFSSSDSNNSNEECFLTHHNQHIKLITLNRPERRNAVGRTMAGQLSTILESLHKENKDIRALIIKSSLDDVFCAGADLKERIQMPEQEVGPFVQKLRSIMSSILNLPFPTIAAIEGVAFGGGFELALSCDIRIASERTKMGLSETKLGIIPGAGGTQLLRRVAGISQAKDLIFTGRPVGASEAFQLKIVNYLVPKDQAFVKAMLVADQIALNGPVAVRMAKKAIHEGDAVNNFEDSLLVEEACYDGVIKTKDRLEGLNSFMQKRAPVFTGE